MCLFGLPEPENETDEKDYIQDVLSIQKLIQDHEFKDKNNELNKEQNTIEIIEDITTMFRRGKEKIAEKTRPIIIRFSNLELRQKVLQQHKLVHTDKHGKEIPIYICPDRTMKQQMEHKQLVAQMKIRKIKEPNIAIRNGKIVTLLPFRRNPQIYFQK